MRPAPRPARTRRILAARVALAALGTASAARADQTGLAPFVLPWDDSAPTVTDLSGWSAGPAGQAGRIAVGPDGHFREGDRRIRFLGVNLAADSCYPEAAAAEATAARLAKFGYNAVRFHHMEANWGGLSLIDYRSGGSRTWHAENLARFDYFAARLREHGLYLNLNLLTARQFFAADGLPAEVEQLGWKEQHILGMFHEPCRALHREHATLLLSHRNPHTGLTYAEDPAVALVEIMNENGLGQQWYDGLLDRLPGPFATALRDRWNAWLQVRYAGEDQLRAAWQVRAEPLGPEQIANGSFAQGATGWNLERHQGAAATLVSDPAGPAGATAGRIDITAAAAEGWHIQLHGPAALEQGRIYTLRYAFRADRERGLTVALMRNYDPWTGLLTFEYTTATTAWQTRSITFEAPVTDQRLRINFNGFGTAPGSFWLAGVSLRPGGQLGGWPEGTSLAAGNLPTVPRSRDGTTTAQVDDWIRFLRDQEADYWSDLRSHLADTLGYGGLVVGTIQSTSYPSVQAGFPVIDTHAYWQHPQWTGPAWDPVAWRVPNLAMVNYPPGEVGALARQRVHGRPHLVTEYQHASPNSYSADGPLFLATGAAFQDFDGVFLFAYDIPGPANQGRIAGFFDFSQHPAKMANQILAAALFRRGDLAPAQTRRVFAFDPDRELANARTGGGAWDVFGHSQMGLPGTLALQHGIALAVEPADEAESLPASGPAGPVYQSDTGQWTWDHSRPDRGLVTADTPRTKAVWGFPDGRAVDLGGVEFSFGTLRQQWATAGLTLLQGESLDDPRGATALVIATGEVENTGMQWNADHSSVGDRWGASPTLVEVVPLDLHLPLPPERVRAWPLSKRGVRQEDGEIPATASGTGTRLALGPPTATLWYEVEVAPLGWYARHFSAAELRDPTLSGDAADPDRDGLPNSAERALGSPPRAADTLGPDGWIHWTWWGWFFPGYYPWIWRTESGWLYLLPDGEDGFWAWTAPAGWRWSSPALHPWVYDPATGWSHP